MSLAKQVNSSTSASNGGEGGFYAVGIKFKEFAVSSSVPNEALAQERPQAPSSALEHPKCLWAVICAQLFRVTTRSLATQPT